MNIKKKIEDLQDLVEAIQDEVNALSNDFEDSLFDDAEIEQLKIDIKKFESDLRKSANSLTHLDGFSFPDWGIRKK